MTHCNETKKEDEKIKMLPIRAASRIDIVIDKDEEKRILEKMSKKSKR